MKDARGNTRWPPVRRLPGSHAAQLCISAECFLEAEYRSL
jgi:hypothetical protein